MEFAYPPNDPNGIHVANVTAWFADHVPQARPPFEFTLIAGGHSNLTYEVVDADGQKFVLRRPPMAHVLATAHDMTREFRAIKGLGPTAVPVPPALGLCTDKAVNGADFYVMGYVAGHVLHTLETVLAHYTEAQRQVTGESLFDVLADMHAVDPDSVGLGEHGPKEGYVTRQLNRWYKQWNAMKDRDLPAIDSVYTRLIGTAPQQGRATVVHGDYRLGNCITGFDGGIVAVLDWEISTLGDPLADLAYLLNTWIRPGDPGAELEAAPPTLAAGFPSREASIARYAERSGRDVSQLDWYIAFNHWKSACIVQGVLSRYLGGALGTREELLARGVDLDAFARSVEGRAADAFAAINA